MLINLDYYLEQFCDKLSYMDYYLQLSLWKSQMMVNIISSCYSTESSQIDSYTPCVDVPDDPPDDSSDVFDDGPTAAINVFNLALDGEDRFVHIFKWVYHQIYAVSSLCGLVASEMFIVRNVIFCFSSLAKYSSQTGLVLLLDILRYLLGKMASVGLPRMPGLLLPDNNNIKNLFLERITFTAHINLYQCSSHLS